MIDEEVRRRIMEAIKTYNRFRSPEARAELVSIGDDKITVRFTGSFCETCGIRDWVEDLVYVLEDHGVEAELAAYIEPPGDEDSRIGVFRIKGLLKEKTVSSE